MENIIENLNIQIIKLNEIIKNLKEQNTKLKKKKFYYKKKWTQPKTISKIYNLNLQTNQTNLDKNLQSNQDTLNR